jgi:RNA polymerase sigma-70 factor (ECF subfamily)
VRLGGLLLELPVTRQPVVHALLALMCLLGARLPARTDEAGDLLTLAHQDRSLWDRERLTRGLHHFDVSMEGNELTPYHLEAAIAVCHAAAPSYADTDWDAILQRYDQLLSVKKSPVVYLNRAVAVAKSRGVDAALPELDRLLDLPSMASYYLLPATRGQLLWVRGDCEQAAACFRDALAKGCSGPERQFLLRRLGLCESGEAAGEW